MTLGEKIAKQRRAMNYTQEQLADFLEVSRQSISKWESNLAYPETDKLLKMGKLFGCSMDYLLDEEVEQEHGPISDTPPADRIGSRGGETVPVKAVLPIRHTVGIILLSAGLLGVILGVLFSILLLLLGIVLVVCGVLCLTVRKHLWLWLLAVLTVLLLLVGTFFGILTPAQVTSEKSAYTESMDFA